MPLETKQWDASEYLDSPETIREYLKAAFEDGDPQLIALSIGDVAKAQSMAEIARKAGLSR